MPPLRPMKPLMSAEEFMYVTGTRRAGDARASVSASQAVLDLAERGHVGHRAAGREVGQDHLLVVGGEDVGALGHEVHAAEDDVLRVRAGRGLPGQLERVAGHVGELDDLVALVVVAEHEDPVAERRLGRRGPATRSGSLGAGRSPGQSTPRSVSGSRAPAEQQQRGRGVRRVHAQVDSHVAHASAQRTRTRCRVARCHAAARMWAASTARPCAC